MGSPETCLWCKMAPSAGRHANYGYCAHPCHATPPAPAASADDRAKAAAPGRLFIACNDAGYFPSGGIASLKENTTYFALKHPEYPFVVEYEKVAPAASAVTRAEREVVEGFAWDVGVEVLRDWRLYAADAAAGNTLPSDRYVLESAIARVMARDKYAALRGKE